MRHGVPARSLAPRQVSHAAGAQSVCAHRPAAAIVVSLPVKTMKLGILARKISPCTAAMYPAAREALDRLAATQRTFRLSYTGRIASAHSGPCVSTITSATVGQTSATSFQGAAVQPVILGADQVVLAPVREHEAAEKPAEPAPMLQKNRPARQSRVVTGSAKRRITSAHCRLRLTSSPGKQLAQHGAGTLSGALDGEVPGLWIWEQSPLSLLTRYGSIRGASSFGVSYPKVYIDGIEVANSLLVTHLRSRIDFRRIEVMATVDRRALRCMAPMRSVA